MIDKVSSLEIDSSFKALWWQMRLLRKLKERRKNAFFKKLITTKPLI